MPHRYRFLTILIVLALPLQLVCAGTEPVTISVYAEKDLGLVPRHVFGQNVEAADAYGIFSTIHSYSVPQTGSGLWDPWQQQPVPEMVAAARAVGMTMLRYPGGCLSHNFNWKDAVGPLESRPNFAFGLDEFINFCRTVGAEPLITVADYVGGPAEAAQLVEYLNAPAVPAHPWAMKRAQWGHPDPYGVHYFEMGNESDHGNHDVKPYRQFTASAYARWVDECARRMRAIDSTISIGVIMGTGTGPEDPWNRIVLADISERIDFIVVHTYVVGAWGDIDTAANPPELLMRACMASGDQVEQMLEDYRSLIHRETGRNIPLAITEYNAAFVQEKPQPYRFAYGPALFAADYLRVLLKPESNVLMANYWQFNNGYWGMVQGSSLSGEQRPWQMMPAYYLFRLWAQHFGTRLKAVDVSGSPRAELPRQVYQVQPSQGMMYRPVCVLSENTLAGTTLESSIGAGYTAHVTSQDAMAIQFEGLSGEHYSAFARVTAQPGAMYQLSFEARARGELEGAKLGIGIIDMRGWFQTKSGNAVDTLAPAADWTPFTCVFASQPECPGVELSWRLLPGAEAITGTLEVRHLRLTAMLPVQFPAYNTVTASASTSDDGRTLYLIVFNKHHQEGVPVIIRTPGFVATDIRRWVVTGPSLDADNLHGEQVWESESGIAQRLADDGNLVQYLPARAMVAYEFTR